MSMDDFFNNKYKFKTIITQDTITHETVEDITGRRVQEIINTKEKATRDALIEMGWVPPEDKEDITVKILDKLLWILDNETYSRGELKGVVAVIDRLFREELVPMTEEDWQDLFAVTERSLRRIDKLGGE